MLKVLVALDGSDTSEQALDLASQLLSGKETETTVFHVIPRHLIYSKGGVVVAETYDPKEERAHAEELLTSSAQRLQDAGVGPTIVKELEVGDPAELILAAAAAKDTDLIVVGSRGLGAARRFLLGSISTKVMTHAHCAVMVAHPKEQHSSAGAT